MASWVLKCPNWSSMFFHSEIEDNFRNYFFPQKPKFPEGGQSLHAGSADTPQRISRRIGYISAESGSSEACGYPILFTALPFSNSRRHLIDPRAARTDNSTLEREVLMLAIIAAVFVVLWLLGFLAFHATSGLIHLLLICAVISFIAHFFRGRASTA